MGNDLPDYQSYVVSPVYLPLTGGVMAGDIDMDGNEVNNLAAPAADDDAARKVDVDTVDAKLNDIAGAAPVRALGTVYQNTSGKLLFVAVTARCRIQAADGDLEGLANILAYTDAATPPVTAVAQGGWTGIELYDLAVQQNTLMAYFQVCFWVKPGDYYKVNASIFGDGYVSLTPTWYEWTLF